MKVSDLAAAGVRRVSIGSGLARIARSAVEQASRLLIESGRLSDVISRSRTVFALSCDLNQ